MINKAPKVYQLALPCPYCNTVCTLRMFKHRVSMHGCPGCSRCVVLSGSILITITSENYGKLEKIFGMATCGKVSDIDLSSRYDFLEPINDEDIARLREALESSDPFTELENL